MVGIHFWDIQTPQKHSFADSENDGPLLPSEQMSNAAHQLTASKAERKGLAKEALQSHEVTQKSIVV